MWAKIQQLENVVTSQQQMLQDAATRSDLQQQALQQSLQQTAALVADAQRQSGSIQQAFSQQSTDFQTQLATVVTAMQQQSQTQHDALAQVVQMAQAGASTATAGSGGGSGGGSSSAGVGLVDTRVLGKPPIFSGDDDDPKNPWSLWSFVARAFFTAAHVTLGEKLVQAASQSDSPSAVDNSTLSAED